MKANQPDLRKAAPQPGILDSWTIIADDLTGASDAAAPFSGHANTTIIIDGVIPPSDQDVVAISTESRYLPPFAAASIVERAVDTLIKQGRKQIFKKIDSQLRGNVGPEVAAALRALGRNGRPPFAVVAPAFPAAGRTTVDGTVLIEEVGAAGGKNTKNIVESLRRGGLRAVVIARDEYCDATALATRIRGISRAECDAAVVDCTTDEDLAAVASAWGIVGSPTLMVGSGGLAAALANSFPGAPGPPVSLQDRQGNALVVIGSYSDRSRQQLDELTSSGVRHLWLNHADPTAGQISAEVLKALNGGHVVLTPDPLAPVEKLNAPQIAKALGQIVRAVGPATRILVLCGGETARATLEALDIRQMHVEGELQPGVVVHSIPARDLTIVTKAGAFGDRKTIINVLERIGQSEPLIRGVK